MSSWLQTCHPMISQSVIAILSFDIIEVISHADDISHLFCCAQL